MPLTTAELEARVKVALDLTRQAGRLALDRFGADDLELRTKRSPLDLVSDADIACERILVEGIRAAFPMDGLLSEEGASHQGSATWILDPIDGTANFAAGIGHWAVVAGLCDEAGPALGIVCDPVRRETFWAWREGGLWHNGVRLGPPVAPELGLSTWLVSFPSRRNHRRHLAWLKQVRPNIGRTRDSGSTALDMAYASAGRVHGVFHDRTLSDWDHLPIAALCREAGLEVWAAEPGEHTAGALLVASGAWARWLIERPGLLLEAAEAVR